MKSDHELIREFQNGDENSYNILTKRYVQKIYGYFVQITGDEMDAEDLTQDVFLKLYKNLKKFRFDSKFSTYLYRINSNQIASYFRKSKWRKLLNLNEYPELIDDPEDFDREWTRQKLRNVISTLPKKQQAVVTMRIIQQLPFKDIAEVLNISDNSAKVNYHHAVKRLKEKLGEI
jgi:RNA polymerase sigma-70 factor (ECF subfamily)